MVNHKAQEAQHRVWLIVGIVVTVLAVLFLIFYFSAQKALFGKAVMVQCGSSYVDIESDENNCGACGLICPFEYTCEFGKCRISLPENCIDNIDNDGDGVVDGPVVCSSNTDCGTLGNACSPGQVCRDGACVTGGCTSDAACASTPSTPVCNTTTGVCEARQMVINNGDYDADGLTSSASDAVKFNWHLLFGQLLANAGKTYADDTCGAAGENPCPIGDTGKFICDDGKGLASNNQTLCI